MEAEEAVRRAPAAAQKAVAETAAEAAKVAQAGCEVTFVGARAVGARAGGGLGGGGGVGGGGRGGGGPGGGGAKEEVAMVAESEVKDETLAALLGCSLHACDEVPQHRPTLSRLPGLLTQPLS